MMLARLAPKATMAELHPPGTAFAPRSSLERTRWVYTDDTLLEAATGYVVAVLGPMPLICHRGAATEEALQFMRLAGLETPADLRRYESEAEAIALAQTLGAVVHLTCRSSAAGEVTHGFGERLIVGEPMPAMSDAPGSRVDAVASVLVSLSAFTRS